MAKTLMKQEPDEREQPRRDEDGLLEAVVRDSVLAALGRPAVNYRMQVKRVFGNNYRVNLFVGPDVSSLTIAHSYFLSTDGNGKILTCNPPIVRAD